MADNTERMIGEVSGKLDTLMDTLKQWQADHNARHEKIDEKLEEHAAALNQARGAKAAIFTTAGLVSGLVAIAAAAAERIWK